MTEAIEAHFKENAQKLFHHHHDHDHSVVGVKVPITPTQFLSFSKVDVESEPKQAK